MFGCIHARALHIFGSGGGCHSGYNFIHFHAFFGKNSPKSLRCAGEFLDFPKQITHLDTPLLLPGDKPKYRPTEKQVCGCCEDKTIT